MLTRILVCLLGLAALACGPKERTISGPLQLGPEWTEIKPDPPLESTKVIQTLAIDLPAGVEVKTGFRLIGVDGSEFDVEAEIVDERGEVFRHRLARDGGHWVGFTVVPEKMPKEDPLPYYLPPDRRYPLVRMRSNPPLTVKAVRWVCSPLK